MTQSLTLAFLGAILLAAFGIAVFAARRSTTTNGFYVAEHGVAAWQALLHGSALETGEALEQFQQDTFGMNAAQLIRARNNPRNRPIPKRSRPFWAQTMLPA